MCCTAFLKVMMFIFNGGIFLAGAAILGVGLWAKFDSDSLLSVLNSTESLPYALSQAVNISYVLIGVGAVLLLLGFLGCCGAITENRCMLLTFFCIVLIIFLVEVAGAVVLLVFQGVARDLLDSLEDEVREEIRKKYGEDNGVTSLWNATMEHFQCCGYKNYTDFDGSPFNLEYDAYPHTCCNTTNIYGVCNEFFAQNQMIDGCFEKMVQLIEDNAALVAGVSLGVAALEIAAMVVSMVLYKSAGTKA